MKHISVIGLWKTHMRLAEGSNWGSMSIRQSRWTWVWHKRCFQNRKLREDKERKKTKEQNGCLDTEEEEEEAESEGKLPHSYRHTTREPPLHSKDHLWLEMDVLCVFKNISVLILVPVEQAEQRGEKGRRRQAWKGLASGSYCFL